MVNVIYYNEFVRCYRTGVVERLFKQKGWTIVKNTANNSNGYNAIRINKKTILRHRLIAFCWLGLNNLEEIKRGEDVIDHKNHTKLDNSVVNLRITDQSGNNENMSNVKGFYWNKRDKKWQAQIGTDGKVIQLGYYEKEEDAHNAYLDAKLIYHVS